MKRLKITLPLKIFLLIIIIGLSIFRLNNPKASIYKNETEFTGVIINIKSSKCQNITLKAKEKLLIYDCNNEKYKIGQEIKVNGKLQKPKNSITFNYQNYLLSQSIYYTVYAEEIKVLNEPTNIFYKIKNNLYEKTENYKTKEYLNAFVLGNNSLIDEEVKESYQNNGISHLLAISGMHITFLSTILLFIFNKLFKNKKISFYLISVFLLFYIFITNFSPSVIRAVLMFILIKVTNKKSIQIIITLFLLFILINPFYIYNIGFLFSFTITFFLILFKEKIKKHENYFIKTFIISFVAFLASIPIMINSFYKINLLSPIINVIFVPFASLIIYPLSLLTYIFPILDFPLEKIISIFEMLSFKIESLKFLTIIMKDINIMIFILYYLVIYLSLRDKKYLIILFIMILLHHNINIFDKSSFITMIDVGQGDSILLKLSNKSNILIDTGGNINSNIAKKRIIPYLSKEGITKLDYLILSHGDYDHAGAAIDLNNNFKVEKIIMNKNDNELETKIKKEHKSVINADKYKIKIEEFTLEFINKTFKDENDSSLIIYTKINGNHIILMGDASENSEDYILDEYNLPKMDILKVGHHGSSTSSSEQFIEKIQPKTSLISSGLNNRYGHPSSEVVNRLKKYGTVYNTAYDGTVKLFLAAR